MAAWEAKMSTFPTSPSAGGEESSAFPSTPGKPPHGGGKIRGDGSLGEMRDDTLLTFSTASSSRRKCVCASAQPTSHRPNVATLGNTQGQACALCWRKTHCAGGTLEMYPRRHVCVGHVSNIYLSSGKVYISSGGDASETNTIHQHNTPLQHTRTTATPSASPIATHSPQC